MVSKVKVCLFIIPVMLGGIRRGIQGGIVTKIILKVGLPLKKPWVIVLYGIVSNIQLQTNAFTILPSLKINIVIF